jgi:ATP-binding cassette subfamily B protein
MYKYITEKAEEFKTIVSNLRFLLAPYLKYGRAYCFLTLVFLGMVVYPCIAFIHAFSLRYILNGFSSGKEPAEMILLLLLIEGVLFVLGTADSVFSEMYSKKIALRVSSATDKELFDKAVVSDYKNYDSPDYYSDYTFASKQYASNSAEAMHWLTDLVQSVVTMILLSATILSGDFVIIGCVLLTLVFRTVISKKMSLLGKETQLAHIPFNRKRAYVQKLFYVKEFAADMKCTRLPNFARWIYDEATGEKYGLIDKYKGIALKYRILSGAVEFLFSMSVSSYLVFRVCCGDISFGDFAGYSAAAVTLRNNIGVIFGAYAKAYAMSTYATQVRRFFDASPEIEMTGKSVQLAEGPFDVELRDVSFSYSDSGFALKNLNLHINAGEKIALVGENGAGKTTLIKLILRLYDPINGGIYVNGRNIRDFDPKEYRLDVGSVFQKTYLYTMKYIKNLSLYRDMSDDEIEDVSRALGLDRVLEKNGADIHSEVGREFDGSGIVMSDGEAQKVGIARILSGSFGLLVLDEPNSSLDPLMEYELNKMILEKSGDSTTIIISHRLSTVRKCDRIVVMVDGEITETGTHDELITAGGVYCDMWKKQSEAFT